MDLERLGTSLVGGILLPAKIQHAAHKSIAKENVLTGPINVEIQMKYRIHPSLSWETVGEGKILASSYYCSY